MKLYMYAIPRALPQYRNARIAGELVYHNRTQQVPQDGVDQGFVRELGALIRRVASDTAPQRVPSVQECRFCDISSVECPERVEVVSDAQEGTTADF